MSIIKNNMKLLIFIFVMLIIGGTGYYITSILFPQLETLQILREQNDIKNQQLELLQEELTMLSQTKRQIQDIQMKVKALKNKIPSYQMSAITMMELMQYMEIYKFEDIEVDIGEATQQESNKDIYYKVPVTIKYTNTYSNTAQFIHEINRSYQIITVEHISIDNRIQEERKNQGEKFISEDFVQVQVSLSLYYNEKEGSDTTQHPNFMEFSNKEEQVFLRTSVEEFIDTSRQKDIGSNSNSPFTIDNEENSIFDIYVADPLRSGDNYTFSSYALGEEPVYVGLTSSKDTKIAVTIRASGYSCVIEDSDGKKSEKKVNALVRSPSINITSQIQKVMENMPDVKIYIYNYTDDVINVNMRGSELDKIYIFNENGEQVPKGNKLGKVSLST